ncbi:MAG: hypothetical protein KDJ12_11930, partial [Hyphomicrobiales bacterium]|nr:hypothetical protein [Hyphomicrobiales bacterium]
TIERDGEGNVGFLGLALNGRATHIRSPVNASASSNRYFPSLPRSPRMAGRANERKLIEQRRGREQR